MTYILGQRVNRCDPLTPPGDAGNGGVNHALLSSLGIQVSGLPSSAEHRKHPYHVIFVQRNEVSAMKPMVAGPDEMFRSGNFGVALKRLSFSAAPPPLPRG
jgi:hypothetical protein